MLSLSQSCPTLCDPMDCSPPGSSVQGLFQARILEQVAISTPGYLPDPGIEPMSLMSPALAGGFFTTEPPGKPQGVCYPVVAAAAKLLQSCPTLCNPIDGSPPGSPCPWDSPGKNTGVGCHFLLQRRKVKSENEVPQSCPTLSDPMDCSPPGSSIHGIFQARVLERGAIAWWQKAQNLQLTVISVRNMILSLKCYIIRRNLTSISFLF